MDEKDQQMRESLRDWARREGLILTPEKVAALELALGMPEHPAAERDHRGVILPPRHRAGGIITPQ